MPRAVVEALRRGLSVDPADRWPSMEALLTVIDRDPRGGRERWWLGATIGTLAVLGGAATQWPNESEPPCTGAQQQLSEIWDDARRGEVEAAVLGIDQSFAEGALARTLEALDTYADEWVAMHTEACEATAVRMEQSSRVLDLRMGCLSRGRDGLDATVSTLVEADAAVVSRAEELVANLSPLSRCADTEALEAGGEPPLPAEVEAVAVGHQQLAKAATLRIGGRYEDAQRMLEEASRTLDGVAYVPVRAELALQRGLIAEKFAHYAQAVRAYEETLTLALQSDQLGIAARSVSRTMVVVGAAQMRFDDALLHRPLLRGLSEGEPLLEAQAHNAMGQALFAAGDRDEAEQSFRAAVAVAERTLAPMHPVMIESQEHLAKILRARDLPMKAEAEHRRLLTLRQQQFGPEHPHVVALRGELAIDLVFQGRYEEAEAELRGAVASMESMLGPDHPRTLKLRSALAGSLNRQGERAEAETEYRAVLEGLVRDVGPDHLRTATAQMNLAAALMAQHEYEEAEPLLRASVRTHEKALGTEHPTTMSATLNLGSLLVELRKFDEAEVYLRNVVEAGERVLGADHSNVLVYRASLIHLLKGSDRHAEALLLAERSWRSAQHPDRSPRPRTWTTTMLASLLWDIEGPQRDRARARRLVLEVLETLDGPEDERRIQKAEQWLEDHPAP